MPERSPTRRDVFRAAVVTPVIAAETLWNPQEVLAAPKFPPPEVEVRRYGRFALGNRGHLTVAFLTDYLRQKGATSPNDALLAKFMIQQEEIFGIGSEYVVTLATQETQLGKDIGTKRAPKAGRNNWLNWGKRNQRGKFPDFVAYETVQQNIYHNLALGGFNQLHRYHRVWGIGEAPENVDPDLWKPYHTFDAALTAFAPHWENPNLRQRIIDGKEMIDELRAMAR